MGTIIVDERDGTTTYRSGMRPELVIVAPLSYNLSGSFGSGVPIQGTYSNVEIADGTIVTYQDTSFPPSFIPVSFTASTCATYRIRDDRVIFDINIDLNTKNAAPTGNGVTTLSELRIRNLVPITSLMGTTTINTTQSANLFSRSLPAPSVNYMPPIINEVQIYNLVNNNGNVFWTPMLVSIESSSPDTSYSRYQARLINDDTLALVLSEKSPFIGSYRLTYSAFNAAAGFSLSNLTGSTTRISVKGVYLM